MICETQLIWQAIKVIKISVLIIKTGEHAKKCVVWVQQPW